ncbi:hypothetical protein VP01_588g4 [Puccinia sorghi]|uniref:Uncharacterized protein n=1 Tax=Puccinia sorghi TaxID=27349 RepID=A0A0L6UHX5_9BASI|nr:hypothetical protein VP01_588g4 [Puccinia sorghi]
MVVPPLFDRAEEEECRIVGARILAHNNSDNIEMEQPNTNKQASSSKRGTAESLRNNPFLAKAKLRSSLRDVTTATDNRKRTRDGTTNQTKPEGTSSKASQDDLKPLPKRIRKFSCIKLFWIPCLQERASGTVQPVN